MTYLLHSLKKTSIKRNQGQVEVQIFIKKKIDNSIEEFVKIILESNVVEKPIKILDVLKKTSIKEVHTSAKYKLDNSIGKLVEIFLENNGGKNN